MILVVDMNCTKDSLGFYEFVLPIVAVVNELDDYEVKHYIDVGKDAVDDCDGVILSGTPLKDTVTLRQLDKFQWIKTCGKPILGVCAGMQTIGLIYGSRLGKCFEIGMTRIATVTENPLFSSTFEAYELHNFSITPSKEFEILAKSARCVQAIKHKQKEIYGVLFHPEVRNQEILQRFVRTLGKHRRV